MIITAKEFLIDELKNLINNTFGYLSEMKKIKLIIEIEIKDKKIINDLNRIM